MQAEMQRLKEKLAISERTANAEAQLKVNIDISSIFLPKFYDASCLSINVSVTSGKNEAEAKHIGRGLKTHIKFLCKP
jgi:hypothetical protein